MEKKFFSYSAFLIIALLTTGFIVFFYQGLPFLWEDVDQINLSVTVSYSDIVLAYLNPFPNFYWGKTLVRDASLADRPVQVFIAKFFNDLFGYTPFPYHFLKSIFLFLTVILLFYFIRRETGSRYPAMLAGIMFLTAIPVYESVLWCLEMEIVSQFLMLIIFILFFNLFNDESKKWKDTIPLQILILFLYLTAMKAKPSCSIIAPVLIFYILLINYRKAKIYFPLCFVMLTVALLPKFLSPSFYYHQEIKLPQVEELSRQSVIVVGIPLLTLLLISLCAIIFQVKQKETRGKIPGLVLFFALWSFFSVCLWPILPSSETRYLAQSAIPFSSLIAVSAYCAISMIPKKKIRSTLLILFLIPATLQIWENLKLDTYYRGFWGSFFIARNEVYSTIEKEYSNSLICYLFNWREVFYPYKGSKNKWVWVSKENEKLSGILIENDISIYQGGVVEADKFEHIFWIFPVKHPPDIPILKKVRGKTDTLFDSFAETFNPLIKDISIMTLELGDKNIYPVTLYISKVK